MHMSGVSPLILARLVRPGKMVLPVSFSAKEDLACVVISACHNWETLNLAIGFLSPVMTRSSMWNAICHYCQSSGLTPTVGWLPFGTAWDCRRNDAEFIET